MNSQNLPGAVFLDRDGTINRDSGYISRSDDFELYSYSAEAIRMLNNLGFLIFIVTNQSGVARGFYTMSDLEGIHNKMTDLLAEQNAYIDKVYISPYFDTGIVAPYNISHQDRKPGIGLFKKAEEEFRFDSKKSFMVGDRYSDIMFGKKSHLKTFLVLSGDGDKEFYENRNNWEKKPDFIVKNLLSAAKLIRYLSGSWI